MESAFTPVFQLPVVFWGAAIIVAIGLFFALPTITSYLNSFLAPYRTKLPGMMKAAVLTDLLFVVVLAVVTYFSFKWLSH